MTWLSYLELGLLQMCLGKQTWGHPEQGVPLSGDIVRTIVRTGYENALRKQGQKLDLFASPWRPQDNSYPSKTWKRQNCRFQKEHSSASNLILDFKLLELWENKVPWPLTSQIVALYYSAHTEENTARHNHLAILLRKNELLKAKLFFNVA